MRHRLSTLGAGLLIIALTALLTWPQAEHLSSKLSPHFDARFSIWRLGWIAHSLITAPTHIFDANIFYPARTTLAYSDTVMLEGVLAAPLFWLGVSPVLIYNLTLFAGIVGSGMAMYLLAREVTVSAGAALVAAAVFTMLPYRTEHFMHLELQWSMFVPLTFLALHRAVERESVGYGIAAGVCIWLQVVSCVYYGVFLAMLLAFFAPALVLLRGAASVRQSIRPVAVAALVSAVLSVPMAVPYLAAARDIGFRPHGEIARYSASLVNYLSAPMENRLWGWTANRWGLPELRLFPGLAALVLAAIGVARRPSRTAILYALTALVAIVYSFGTNNPAYAFAIAHVTPMQGFRATARFGMFAGFAIAVLAGFGVQALVQRPGLPAWVRYAIVPVAIALIALEGSNHALPLEAGMPKSIPEVYRVLRSAPPGTVVEMPVPRLNSLPGYDPTFQAWALWHWKPLVNGYSGYYPADYINTIIRMEIFPEESSISRLRAHDVRYIVVHHALYEPERLANLMSRFASRPELKSWGTYKDPLGTAELFELLD